jgi:hypothetical protein
VCIIDGSGSFSWYTNPDVWNYVLMKPFWGACTWEFVNSGIEVPTGIDEVITENENAKDEIYDLSGRRVSKPTSGIYIVNGEKRVIK